MAHFELFQTACSAIYYKLNRMLFLVMKFYILNLGISLADKLKSPESDWRLLFHFHFLTTLSVFCSWLPKGGLNEYVKEEFYFVVAIYFCYVFLLYIFS